MAEFDAYLAVDWSASSKPKTGEDSIWYCMVIRTPNALGLACKNHATRDGAIKEIGDLLATNVRGEIATLVGFDFPYGYPAGCAAVLKLQSEKVPPWRALWNFLSERIRDDPRNRNNRFEVAAELNKLISGRPYPFWGCPREHSCPTLSPKKPSAPPHLVLPEYRLAEQRARGAQSAWKLLGRGAVGSQTLLGIPCIARLRDDPRLRAASRVWPFETGLGSLPSRPKRHWFVLHAEIYPAIIKGKLREGEIKDAAQVRNLATYFARLDEQGCLSRLFERPPDLSSEEQQRVKTEEGWILGVQ